jgi:hypothetical protein
MAPMGLVFVDCEAYGGCPALGALTEIGAVTYPDRRTFHGILVPTRPRKDNPAIPEPAGPPFDGADVFRRFDVWLKENTPGRPVMVSDNPAFDFQWVNDGFLRYLGQNPFGHSARRLSDFYAGLRGDFRETQGWKRLRITPHDHNPVNDAMGNLEAFERMLRGER